MEDKSDSKDIKNGDVVRLISGGPRMTIEHVNGAAVRVRWFPTGDETMSRYESFQAIALVKVND